MSGNSRSGNSRVKTVGFLIAVEIDSKADLGQLARDVKAAILDRPGLFKTVDVETLGEIDVYPENEAN